MLCSVDLAPSTACEEVGQPNRVSRMAPKDKNHCPIRLPPFVCHHSSARIRLPVSGCPYLGGTLPYICGRMVHQLTVLKRGPQKLQRKPSEYLRSIYMDIGSPPPRRLRSSKTMPVSFSGHERCPKSRSPTGFPWLPRRLVRRLPIACR